MTDNTRIACKAIVNYYGVEHQKEKLIEEMAELMVAIKHRDSSNYVEELADVSIILEGLIRSLPKNDYIDFLKTQEEKVKRQFGRMAVERADYEEKG